MKPEERDARRTTIAMFSGRALVVRLVIPALVMLAVGFDVAIAPLTADDDVVWVRADNDEGRVAYRGSIREWIGNELVIEANGRSRRIAGDDILAVDTLRSVAHEEAQGSLARGDFPAALKSFAVALQAETRPWVRREILAGTAQAALSLGQWELSAQSFLQITAADPATRFAYQAPLEWTSRNAPANRTALAREWLAADDSWRSLIAASWLISGPQQREAADQLRRLAQDSQPIIAHLATAQLWRSEMLAAPIDTVERWQRHLERMPPSITAGPSLIVGQALVRHGRLDDGLARFLRPAILLPENYQVAADGLRQALTALAGAGRTDEAQRVRQMLVAEFSQSLAARELSVASSTSSTSVAVPRRSTEPYAGLSVAVADDLRLSEGLNERRLFAVAGQVCRSALESDQLTPADAAALAVQLVRTHVSDALAEGPADRLPLWQAAHAAAAEFLEKFPTNPRCLLVAVQDALVDSARGQLARRELDLAGSPAEIAARREESLESLRTAVASLKDLDQELEAAIAAQQRAPRGTDGLATEELMMLRTNVRYQLAVCYQNRALAHAPYDEANRADALSQALAQLTEVLSLLRSDHPVWWDAQLARVAVYRQMANWAEARRLLDAMPLDDAAPIHRLKWRAESIALALDRNDLADTQTLLDQGRSHEGQTSPDLDLSILQLLLRMAQSTDYPAAARAELENQAVELARLIELEWGGYYARRANQALVNAATVAAPLTTDTTSPPANAELVMRLAADAERKSLWADAIAAYDRAYQIAMSASDSATALRAGYRAAWISEQQGQHAQAAERLVDLARQFAPAPEAPSFLLAAAWNLAQIARSSPDRQADYAATLDDLIGQWPNDPAADQARVWRARLHVQLGEWQPAIDQLMSVAPGSPHLAAAMRELDEPLGRRVGELRDAGSDWSSAVQAIIAQLMSRIGEDAAPPRWTAGSREALLAWARLQLVELAEPDVRLLEWLHQAIDDEAAAPADDDDWRSRAKAWLIVAMVLDPAQRLDAARVLEEVRDAAGLELVLEGFEAVAARQPADPQRDAVMNQLLDAASQRALAAAAGATGDPATWRRWTLVRASVLDRQGKVREASDLLADAAARLPDDAEILLAHARLVSKQSVPEALVIWKELADRFQPYAPSWWECKYELARLLDASGRRAEARRLLEYLQVTPPGWNDSPWRAQLEELLARCAS